ncbi:Clan CE, family C48, Ulp1-like cysteine peptidase [Tritrichomonas foetus]|uniref:Clan CE, family C48, Ulp1-like cysteine peptidase n=1 Tax=Tritrichomonas foetus TaxID=1144522 RepID=A0A1J4JGU5_9EUKA|nr:Clan CE, family C48, Ulp1-like cysteine peptidase [Tritrichomonas foetus]|eukprot:OHS98384.1 Clan CE, family C48, Ulp1-like cysteine peptidase [Tritrichomonas foetus]
MNGDSELFTPAIPERHYFADIQAIDQKRPKKKQVNNIPERFKVEKKIFIIQKDIDSLGRRKWLSDGVINSYLTYLHNTKQRYDIGYTNTFFYHKLTNYGSEEANKWGGIWETKLDIFSHFLIPLTTGSHWFLIDLDFEKQKMNVYDSFSYTHLEHTTNINAFLNYQQINSLKVVHPEIPQQTNGYDCGVFLLKFAELIYEGKKINKKSFSPSFAIEYRKKIANILKNYLKKESEESDS